jgi:hypothetical protein
MSPDTCAEVLLQSMGRKSSHSRVTVCSASLPRHLHGPRVACKSGGSRAKSAPVYLSLTQLKHTSQSSLSVRKHGLETRLIHARV